MSDFYRTIPNVFQDPLRMRDRGLRAKFADRQLKDGQVYKRVAEDVIPELCDSLITAAGRPITLEAMGWRLNYANELPNKYIHADAGWGNYAAVVGMDPNVPEGCGTAFWRHKATGATNIHLDDIVTYFAVMNDWNDASKFEQVDFAQMVFNQAVVYDSTLLHSRWPFEAYGDSPETGRLSIVAFYS